MSRFAALFAALALAAFAQPAPASGLQPHAGDFVIHDFHFLLRESAR